jgi:hypothetical protein
MLPTPEIKPNKLEEEPLLKQNSDKFLMIIWVISNAQMITMIVILKRQLKVIKETKFLGFPLWNVLDHCWCHSFKN